jgi:hypothetical protein
LRSATILGKSPSNPGAVTLVNFWKGLFKAQLAELQNQALKDKLSKGASLQSLDESSISFTASSSAVGDAVNKAVFEIQRSIVDDIIGIVTVDVIIATLIGAFLTPLGSAVFLAVRRWMSGQAEEKKHMKMVSTGGITCCLP